MPQNQSVDQILAGAKAELGKANAMSASMPKVSAPTTPTPSPAPKPAPKPSLKNELDAKGQMVNQAKKALEGTGVVPKMHRGGPVKADGVYQLKKGEHVLTAPEAHQARKHALAMSGMASLARGMAQPMTSGEPVAAMKKPVPAKKNTQDIRVRPEKKQAAQVKPQVRS